MNALERIAATVGLRKTDRVPVIAQVFGHAGVIAGVSLADYVRNGEQIAHCQLRALERYGYDAVFSVMDVGVETEASGSVLEYRRHQYPTVKQYALCSPSDIDKRTIPDPDQAGRMPEMLKALGILRRELGDDVLVVGCILGPLTLAMQLMGAEAALYLAIDDPSGFERMLDFATETIIRFGCAQLRSGAHLPVVFDPSASPAVVPPQFFREFEHPRLTRIFQALSEAGSKANWLHIAGPVGPILSTYPSAGVTIANFDYCVSAADAASALPTCCLDGNIKSLAFAESKPAEIAAESGRLLAAFRERGGFLLSSGCEIPPESKPENISALVAATRSAG